MDIVANVIYGDALMEIDLTEIGRRIANKRKSLEYTQGTLAEKTGFSVNHISNIENNNTTPSIDAVVKIASALGTTPDYLLLGINNKRYSKSELLMQRASLCSDKQLDLLSSFLDWVIDKDI